MKVIESFHTMPSGNILIEEGIFGDLFGGNSKGFFGLMANFFNPTGDKTESQYEKDQKEYQKWAEEKMKQQKQNLDNELKHQHDLEKEYKHQQHLEEMGQLKKEEAIKQANRKRELDAAKYATKKLEEANKKLDLLIKNPLCGTLTEESANFYMEQATRILDSVTPADKKACQHITDTFAALVYDENGSFRKDLKGTDIDQRGKEVFGEDQWNKIKTSDEMIKMRAQCCDENGNPDFEKVTKALQSSQGITQTKDEAQAQLDRLSAVHANIKNIHAQNDEYNKTIADFEKQKEQREKDEQALKDSLGGKDLTDENIKNLKDHAESIVKSVENGKIDDYNKEIKQALSSLTDDEIKGLVKFSRDAETADVSMTMDEGSAAYKKLDKLGVADALKKQLDANKEDNYNNFANISGDTPTIKTSVVKEMVTSLQLKDEDITDDLKKKVRDNAEMVKKEVDARIANHNKGGADFDELKKKYEEAQRHIESNNELIKKELELDGKQISEADLEKTIEQAKLNISKSNSFNPKEFVDRGMKIAQGNKRESTDSTAVQNMTSDEKERYDNIKPNMEKKDDQGTYVEVDGKKTYRPVEGDADYDANMKKYEAALKQAYSDIKDDEPTEKNDGESDAEFAIRRKQWKVNMQAKGQALQNMTDDEREESEDRAIAGDEEVDNDEGEDTEDSTSVDDGEEDEEGGDYAQDKDGKKVRQNPKKIWKRRKNKNGTGTTKGYYNKDKQRISAKEYQQKVKSYQEWKKKKKSKTAEGSNKDEKTQESVNIIRKGMIVEFSSRIKKSKKPQGFHISHLSNK